MLGIMNNLRNAIKEKIGKIGKISKNSKNRKTQVQLKTKILSHTKTKILSQTKTKRLFRLLTLMRLENKISLIVSRCPTWSQSYNIRKAMILASEAIKSPS